jgi:hypothetical protein
MYNPSFKPTICRRRFNHVSLKPLRRRDNSFPSVYVHLMRLIHVCGVDNSASTHALIAACLCKPQIYQVCHELIGQPGGFHLFDCLFNLIHVAILSSCGLMCKYLFHFLMSVCFNYFSLEVLTLTIFGFKIEPRF